MKTKISLLTSIVGDVKVGKTHFGMLGLSGDGSDTLMIDVTPASQARIAAMRVYGKNFDDRYYRVSDMEITEVEKIIDEHSDIPTICIDESRNFRDIFATPVLETINEERAKENKKPIKTIFPITRWADVYADAEKFFSKNDGKHNFVITGGQKDKLVFDQETKQLVPHPKGLKKADGLKIIGTLCDLALKITLKENVRTAKVLVNRLVDGSDVTKWVDTTTSLKELFDQSCINSGLDKSMFVGCV